MRAQLTVWDDAGASPGVVAIGASGEVAGGSKFGVGLGLGLEVMGVRRDENEAALIG